MKNLKLYAKTLLKVKALEEILKDLHPLVLRELRKYPDGKTDCDGVEFHLTKKLEKKYDRETEQSLKELREKINEIKQLAEVNGKLSVVEKETFDAEIPRSVKEQLFSKVSDYKKYFGIGG